MTTGVLSVVIRDEIMREAIGIKRPIRVTVEVKEASNQVVVLAKIKPHPGDRNRLMKYLAGHDLGINVTWRGEGFQEPASEAPRFYVGNYERAQSLNAVGLTCKFVADVCSFGHYAFHVFFRWESEGTSQHIGTCWGHLHR